VPSNLTCKQQLKKILSRHPVELPIDDGQTEMDEEQTLALESPEE
jgi:hypothetical protein